MPIFLKEKLVWFTIFYLVSIFFAGAINPLLQSQLSTMTHPNNRGAVLGLQTSAGSVGWFFSPLAGSAIAIYLDLKYIFLFFSISLFLSFTLVFFVHRMNRKRSTKFSF
jgi:MFS family permease